jgi:hypothetical protein
VACPFFMPIEKLEKGPWLHASRLPLGSGWNGRCTAPGHEDEIPSPQELQDLCNLGYAHRCSRLPRARAWDSIRFGARITGDGKNGSRRIEVRYVCEKECRPAEHGILQFDPAAEHWAKPHPDPRVQRMAECFVESYMLARKNQDIRRVAS